MFHIERRSRNTLIIIIIINSLSRQFVLSVTQLLNHTKFPAVCVPSSSFRGLAHSLEASTIVQYAVLAMQLYLMGAQFFGTILAISEDSLAEVGVFVPSTF